MRDGHMVKKKRIKSQKGKENGREGEKRERKGKKIRLSLRSTEIGS